MRQQAVVLEDHGDPLAAKLREVAFAILHNVLAVETDRAARRLDQPDQAAREGGLAAAREAHHHVDLAGTHGKRDVTEGDYGAKLILDFGSAFAIELRLK